MSNIKDALSTLCQFINPLVNTSLTPEHLRLAKYNSPDENGTKMLLNTLHVLSYHAAREKCNDVDFRNYDILSAVKLHFAFLQYPAIEFYGLSQSDNQNRIPLIALAWLLGTQDVLSTVLRTKLINSPLGSECWPVDTVDPKPTTSSNVKRDNQPLSMSDQLNNILYLNGKVNMNLKEISELTSEWAKLTCKVHEASIDYFGSRGTSSENPLHLSVSELALMKRLATLHECSAEDQRRLQEWRDAAALLDAHAKWLDKRDVYFEWMTTVVREHKRSIECDIVKINPRELATFLSLLRQIFSDQVRLRKSEETTSEPSDFAADCSSRMQRCNDTEEVQKWLDDLNERQKVEEESLQLNMDRLADELEEMLRLIPSTVCV